MVACLKVGSILGAMLWAAAGTQGALPDDARAVAWFRGGGDREDEAWE